MRLEELTRVSPNSIEAENQVIGAMMLEKEAAYIAADILVTEDFYSEANKEIFDAVLDVMSINKPVDIITVSERLEKRKSLDKVGGIAYLSDLGAYVITTVHIRHYCEVVKSKSVRRKYIKAASVIADMAYTGDFESITDFRANVMAAVDIPVKKEATELTHISNVMPKVVNDINERGSNKYQSSMLKYGLPWLDNHTGGLWGSQLIIIAARPSTGKTAYMLQIMRTNAYRNKKLAVFSLEMSNEGITERMLSSVSGITGDKLKNPKESKGITEAIKQPSEELAALDINMFDNIFNVEGICMKAHELNAKMGLDLILIDHLQLISSAKKTQNRNDLVGHITRALKILAKQLKIPVVLLSQLNRAPGTRKSAEPILSDLRDSGNIEQDADVVVFLHDPNYNNYATQVSQDKSEILFILAKQREGVRDVSKKMQYDKTTQVFKEISKWWE